LRTLLSAKQRLGDRLIGVLFNEIPAEQIEVADNSMRPFLERQGIPVLGMLPKSDLLRSVTVEELVNQLKAEVLCRHDRLDLLVESPGNWGNECQRGVEVFPQEAQYGSGDGGRSRGNSASSPGKFHPMPDPNWTTAPSFLILAKAEELEFPFCQLTSIPSQLSKFLSARLVKYVCTNRLKCSAFVK
jgi:hypothetical protein